MSKDVNGMVEFVGFEWRDIEELEGHPDAVAFPVEEDDRAALGVSIEEGGVLEALTITPEGLVIDGIGRLEALRERWGEKCEVGSGKWEGGDDAPPARYSCQRDAGRGEGTLPGHEIAASGDAGRVPCVVVRCRDVVGFVANKNLMGRKRSTGSRVLAHLMANEEAVLEAIDKGDSRSVSRDTLRESGKGNAALRGRKPLPEELRKWSVGEIAKRLKVSNKDVGMAVRLLACWRGGVDDGGVELDERGLEAMEETVRGVMVGATPIRRWRQRLGGARMEQVVSGRAAVRRDKRALRTLTTLVNVMREWGMTEWEAPEDRERCEGLLAEALGLLPECGRYAVMMGMKGWPEADREMVLNSLNRLKRLRGSSATAGAVVERERGRQRSPGTI